MLAFYLTLSPMKELPDQSTVLFLLSLNKTVSSKTFPVTPKRPHLWFPVVPTWHLTPFEIYSLNILLMRVLPAGNQLAQAGFLYKSRTYCPRRGCGSRCFS